jgi:hypothetical protein
MPREKDATAAEMPPDFTSRRRDPLEVEVNTIDGYIPDRGTGWLERGRRARTGRHEAASQESRIISAVSHMTTPVKLTPVTASIVLICLFAFATSSSAQAPTPQVVEGPNIKVLTGLYAQQFQEEMNLMVQALGVSCGTCHVMRNFQSEEKPLKLKAREMLEMTRALNKQYFPDYKPKEGESVLGRVTCYTCHKGEQTPKHSVGQ